MYDCVFPYIGYNWSEGGGDEYLLEKKSRKIFDFGFTYHGGHKPDD